MHWLDGVRGAAALFVVLHHMWLSVWPGFPHDTGPWWASWLLYGHLAVAVFIVVSGFSLALAPVRNGLSLRGGERTFFRRRAWRIIPAYWAALIFSTIVSAVLLRPELGAPVVARAFAVHGLLLQDLIGSQTPNGAFWSIAVEWQIYFAFPIILWLARKTRLELAVAVTAAVVLAAHALARPGSPLHKVDYMTPQFLVLFALGVLIVGVARDGARLRRTLAAIGCVALAAFATAAALQGPEWVVARFFWVDLVFGVAVACLLGIMYMGGARRVQGVLGSRPGLRLGLFSYSIYLIHAPVVLVLNKYVISRLDLPPDARFALFLLVGVPLILALAYAFHLVFEAPFLRSRNLSAVRQMFGFRVRTRQPHASAGAGLALPELGAAADQR